ncbi:Ketopantoate reductase PanG [Acidisarcina polymorpha]|uniref:Ketopantoate reductase PanG n=1 Tax=Acidisarcina polymorpha TaxID=2211140 RepID=A0A2Z5FSF5_9BACT|nr:Ketopantoate reductase PanG [Acidisarcina polymorpha]
MVNRAKSDRPPPWGSPNAVDWEEAQLDAEVLWICVPDREIAGVAQQIAERRADLRRQTVLHSSGALTVKELTVVKQRGAAVAAIAPIFSFPTREPVGLENVLFAVESSPPLSRKLAALVRRLGGRPIHVHSSKKALYHAAATMASPLLVSAIDGAVSMAGMAGLTKADAEAVVQTLAMATLRNYFERGRTASFSGAFARGDVGTVKLHLRGLLAHPNLYTLYQALAQNAIATLPVKNRSDLEKAMQLNIPAARMKRRPGK